MMPVEMTVTRFDLRFGEWGLYLNMQSGKFEIYRASRPDLAHLVLAWGTTSQEVDLHLTYEHEQAMAHGERNKAWVPLARIPRAELERLGEAAGLHLRDLLVPHLLKRWRRFRPGWLARNGYVVALEDPAAARILLTKIAPKKKRKFRLQIQALEDERWVERELASVLGPDLGSEYYDPCVLNAEDVRGRVGPIRLVRHHAGRNEVLMLHYMRGPDEKLGWWGLTSADMEVIKKCLVLAFDWLLLVRPIHAHKFELIAKGLGLDEQPTTRSIADSMRRFLRAPRNPARSPYPSGAHAPIPQLPENDDGGDLEGPDTAALNRARDAWRQGGAP
jgi:hypothetical protein